MAVVNPPPASPSASESVARRGTRVIIGGLIASSLLAGIKIVSGLIGHSYVLIADGFESILDIFSSLVVWGGVRMAATPPNDRFPYGYGRMESLASLVVATVLLLAAAGIAVQSVREIITPHLPPAPWTLAVLVVVILTKEVMYRRLRRAGEEAGSRAMEADAWHHRSDSLTSLAAFIGIGVALICGEGFEAADDWAALAACGVIAFNGVRLLRAALHELLDAAPSAALEQRVRELSGAVDGVRAIDLCRIRKSGLGYFVEIHVVVEGSLSVKRGHDIGHDVKRALIDGGLKILDVTAHVEPHLP